MVVAVVLNQVERHTCAGWHMSEQLWTSYRSVLAHHKCALFGEQAPHARTSVREWVLIETQIGEENAPNNS